MIKYDIKQKGQKDIKVVEFDGLIDQLEYIKKFIENNTFDTANEVNKKDDFYGKHDLLSTIEGMKYGFKKETEYFTEILEETKSYKDYNDGIHMDHIGFAYDMGAVVSGEPECCLNTGLPTVTQCIKILVDLSFPWYYSAESILNRGIAITTLIENLILSGYIVELSVIDFNTQSDMDVMYLNKIDIQNLSIANISFLFTPEYFRKIGFITTDKIRNKESEPSRGRSEMLSFMINKIKRDKIFFVGGGYTGKISEDILKTPQSAIECTMDIFNKFCKKNKIDIVFKLKNKGESNGKN